MLSPDHLCRFIEASTTTNGGAHTQVCPSFAPGKSWRSTVCKPRQIPSSFTSNVALPTMPTDQTPRRSKPLVISEHAISHEPSSSSSSSTVETSPASFGTVSYMSIVGAISRSKHHPFGISLKKFWVTLLSRKEGRAIREAKFCSIDAQLRELPLELAIDLGFWSLTMLCLPHTCCFLSSQIESEE